MTINNTSNTKYIIHIIPNVMLSQFQRTLSAMPFCHPACLYACVVIRWWNFDCNIWNWKKHENETLKQNGKQQSLELELNLKDNQQRLLQTNNFLEEKREMPEKCLTWNRELFNLERMQAEWKTFGYNWRNGWVLHVIVAVVVVVTHIAQFAKWQQSNQATLTSYNRHRHPSLKQMQTISVIIPLYSLLQAQK